jgi:hypothetical protein
MDHISDHIQEWRHRKSLIKVPVPPTFLLEWFLKSLVPQLSKDIATSRVFSEEDAIMRAQQFELIYSQSGLLYNILPDAPRSILDKTRQRAGPHADGIVSSAQTKPAEQLTKQLQQLSIQHTATSQTTALASPPTQTSEVHTVQSTNPKATQQPEGKKKQRKKGKGDKKPNDNAGGDNTEKRKVRYPCNLCGRPPNPSMSSTCRGPKVCHTTTTGSVDEPISTWAKSNSSLCKHGRGQPRNLPTSEQPLIRECIYG